MRMERTEKEAGGAARTAAGAEGLVKGADWWGHGER